MSLLPVEQTRYEEMAKVVDLYIQNVNPTKIAKQLGLRRVDVLDHIEDFKRSNVGNDAMKDRVDELLTTMDQHYSMLIQKAYEIVEEVDRPLDEDEKKKETMTRSQMLSQKKGALDLIAKLEKDRIDILQKSGLMEIDSLGDELAQMEEEKQVILGILEHDLCDKCKPAVMSKIGKMLSDNAKGSVTVVQPGE